MSVVISGTNGISAPAVNAGNDVGQVATFAMSTAPAGWLKANGAAVSRTTYDSLFAVLVTNAGFTSQTFTVTIASPAVFTKTGHGFTGGERLRLSTTGALPTGLNNTADYFVIFVDANTFRVSATPGGTAVNTSGTQSGTQSYLQSFWGLGNGSTTFNVPDMRSEFIRGWADGRAVDTGRAFGSAQGEAIQSHNHLMPIQRLAVRVGTGNTAETATDYFSGDRYTYNSGGPETRPRNVALLACIKF
jgi:microcystin-dependent protein